MSVSEASENHGTKAMDNSWSHNDSTSKIDIKEALL